MTTTSQRITVEVDPAELERLQAVVKSVSGSQIVRAAKAATEATRPIQSALKIANAVRPSALEAFAEFGRTLQTRQIQQLVETLNSPAFAQARAAAIAFPKLPAAEFTGRLKDVPMVPPFPLPRVAVGPLVVADGVAPSRVDEPSPAERRDARSRAADVLALYLIAEILSLGAAVQTGQPLAIVSALLVVGLILDALCRGPD